MWAVVVFGGLVVLLVALLSMPVDTTIKLDTSADKKVRVKTSFLFGLVKRDLFSGSQKAGKNKSGDTGKKKTGVFGVSRVTELYHSGRSISENLRQLAVSLYRQIRFRGVNGSFLVGFEDPAHTGMVFAVISPVNVLLNQLPGYNVSISPSFEDRDVIEGELAGNVRVYPASLILPLLRFGLSGKVLRVVKDYSVRKWKNRK